LSPGNNYGTNGGQNNYNDLTTNTNSRNNLMPGQPGYENYNIRKSFDTPDWYSDTELRYICSILRKKVDEHDILDQKELSSIFEKGLKTLGNKMQDLLLHKAFQSIQ
jgi:hypothetical protein